jgi:para-aminobenzoate synthetase component 1
VTDSPWAWFGGILATDLREVIDLKQHPDALDRGWWAIRATFEGELRGYRFERQRRAPLPSGSAPWKGPSGTAWSSSLDRDGYLDRIARIRRYIEAGDVYQVNLCRVLSASLPPDADPAALATVLAHDNPAPYAGALVTEAEWVVSASPELFLGRDGRWLTSAPIKGTAPSGVSFTSKDRAENVMITDLVRNDLNRVCTASSVGVTSLLTSEEHPGLGQLVSTVRGQLRRGVGWNEILDATFPPGSVSGAPKIRALEVISELEPAERGVYCGAFGFVDGNQQKAQLAVAIRTFFTSGQGTERLLQFGTGAGITYPSDPEAEWQETELKANRLLRLASA